MQGLLAWFKEGVREAPQWGEKWKAEKSESKGQGRARAFRQREQLLQRPGAAGPAGGTERGRRTVCGEHEGEQAGGLAGPSGDHQRGGVLAFRGQS